MDVHTISILIHNMNRTYDLKKSMPYLIKAANESPPVEIFILNYSSKDDMDEYMNELFDKDELIDGNYFTYMKVKGEKHYNSPRARNIAQLNSFGDYGIQWACDSYCHPEFIKIVRELIEKEKPVWMAEGKRGRAIVCRKDEFIASGGYDERFTYYAPEDRDFCDRLRRRGGKFVQFPKELIWDAPTGWKTKLKYLNKSGSHRTQLDKMHKIYEDNVKKGVLVANETGR